MGNVVAKGAHQDEIQEDGSRTLTRSIVKGGGIQADAEELLKPSLDRIAAVDAELVTVDAAEASLRARQAEEIEKLDFLVGKVRDDLWNLARRRHQDPVLTHAFPSGVTGYTKQTPANKPAATKLLATLIETTTHELIPADFAVASATALRAAATAVEGVNSLLLPVTLQGRQLRKQRTVAARLLQVQLARLKKRWRGDGMTESEIHAIIPDRPLPRPGEAKAEAAAPATAPDAPAEPPLPVFTVAAK